MRIKFKKKSAFTILEVLLVVTLISVVSVISIAVFASFQERNNIDVATDTIVQSLRNSCSLARSGKNDSQWGTYIETTKVTIYSGSSYSERDTSQDLEQEFPAAVGLSGITEVNFGKGSCSPDNTGSITVTFKNLEETITINAAGTIGN